MAHLFLPYRKQAYHLLRKLSVPSKKNESFRYSKLNQSFEDYPPIESTESNELDNSSIFSDISLPLPQDSQVYRLNGFIKNVACLDNFVHSLSNLSKTEQKKLQPCFDDDIKEKESKDIFQMSNLANWRDGFFIYVPTNQTGKRLYLLDLIKDVHKQCIYSKNIIILEPGSSLTLIEDHQNKNNSFYFKNYHTRIIVKEGACLKYYRIIREDKLASVVSNLHVDVEKQGTFYSHCIVLGNHIFRDAVHIRLKDANASCELYGIHTLQEEEHIDHFLNVEHLHPFTKSIQSYRGVFSDNSTGVFQSKVIIQPNSYKSYSEQYYRSLNLTGNPKTYAKPQLEVHNDDVSCAHGVVIGKLDKNTLLYLQSRGLDIQQAKTILISSFLETLLQKCDENTLLEEIRSLLHIDTGFSYV